MPILSEGRRVALGFLSVPVVFFAFMLLGIWNKPLLPTKVSIARDTRLCKTIYGAMSPSEDSGAIFRSMKDEPKTRVCEEFRKGDKGYLSTMNGGTHCLSLDKSAVDGGCFEYEDTDIATWRD